MNMRLNRKPPTGSGHSVQRAGFPAGCLPSHFPTASCHHSDLILEFSPTHCFPEYARPALALESFLSDALFLKCFSPREPLDYSPVSIMSLSTCFFLGQDDPEQPNSNCDLHLSSPTLALLSLLTWLYFYRTTVMILRHPVAFF